jgi:hypothetical protein
VLGRVVGVSSKLYLGVAGRMRVLVYGRCAAGQVPLQSEAWRPSKVAGALAKKKVVAFDVGELRQQVAGVTVCAACLVSGSVVDVSSMPVLGAMGQSVIWSRLASVAACLCWMIWGRFGCGGMMDVLQGGCPCRVKRGGPGGWQEL